ncbi:MAG: dihydroorotate dehydrogenase electron transfer subunit [Syntrophomonas sp.]
MPAGEKGLIIYNKEVYENIYELQFSVPVISKECRPGQFVHVIVGNTYDPLLRRPLSLYDVDHENGTITLLYKVVGRGTELLTRLGTNEHLDVMGPLGKGFSVPDKPRRNLLIGGGMGIAPLVYLARQLKTAKHEVTVVYGVERAEQLVARERLLTLGVKLYTATEYGDADLAGLLTTAVVFSGDIRNEDFDFLYTCGPEPMMASWLNYAKLKGIPGEISLEEHMACGVGACLGCARKLKKDDQSYAKVCKDGPVFDLREVEL